MGVYVCMYRCVCIYIYEYVHAHVYNLSLFLSLSVSLYIKYVYVYVYIFTYIYMHLSVYIPWFTHFCTQASINTTYNAYSLQTHTHDPNCYFSVHTYINVNINTYIIRG